MICSVRPLVPPPRRRDDRQLADTRRHANLPLAGVPFLLNGLHLEDGQHELPRHRVSRGLRGLAGGRGFAEGGEDGPLPRLGDILDAHAGRRT